MVGFCAFSAFTVVFFITFLFIIGLEEDARDVNQLVEEHSQKPSTDEIQELQSQQHTEVLQEIGYEKEPKEEEVISTSETKETLGVWERVS